MQVDEHALQAPWALSKYVPYWHVLTHLSFNLTNPLAHYVHCVGLFLHDLHDLSQATQIPLNV